MGIWHEWYVHSFNYSLATILMLTPKVCLFYLVLRGLDTIEDDMTIPDKKKQPLLRQFHKLTVTPGWTFTESGPNEKDRQLLVEYNKVVDELNLLPTGYVCQRFHSKLLTNVR